MFLSLWHYLKGYVIVEVCGGNIEKFLNLITYHGIDIWQVHNSAEGIRFCVVASAFKEIRSDAKKAKCRIKIVSKKGFPFLAFKYKKRRLFVAGIAVFIILLLSLTSFVWLVDVEGNERISAMDIMHTLEENGYETGKLKRTMNLRNAETLLLNAYPDLLWVGIHYEGTRMVVKVSESVLPPEMMPSESAPKALLAKRDALITYIAVEKGKPMVREGDIVKKGDVLVAGEMPIGEEKPDLYYTSAKAAIRGKTIYTATQEISLSQVKKAYTDQTSKTYRFKFFNNNITFLSHKDLKGSYDVTHTLHQLHITKMFPLPFGIEVETQVGYMPTEYTLTEDEAKDILLSRLWQEVKGHLSEGATVLTREVYFKESEGVITGTLYIVAEESIGYEVELEQKMLNEGERINEQN